MRENIEHTKQEVFEDDTVQVLIRGIENEARNGRIPNVRRMTKMLVDRVSSIWITDILARGILEEQRKESED